MIDISFIIIFYSCQDNNNREIGLNRDTVISQLNDSSYISDVRSIYSNKYIYVTDYKRDQILILDKKGSFCKSLGTKGKGAGEFLGAAHLFVSNDTICVYNDGKRSFEFFNFFNHFKTVFLPANVEHVSSFRFFFKGKYIYFTSVSDSNCIVSIDINTNSFSRYGRLIKFKSAKQTKIRNSRHVFYNNNNLIAVSDNLPIIERYDFNGDIKEIFNYSNVSVVKNRIKTINSQKQYDNGYDCLLQDAYYENNRLYLLIYTNADNAIFCNKVLVIDTSKEKMVIQSLYSLGTGWFKSICISDGCIYAFGQNKLVIFSLNI
jgi:hypothetical protein